MRQAAFDWTSLHRAAAVDDDAVVLTRLGIALLAALTLILVALPFDLANGPQYMFGQFGP